jgi:hypothetical protein
MLSVFLGVSILMGASTSVVQSDGCIYGGTVIPPYSTIVVMDKSYYEFDSALGMTPQEFGYSEDGYAILLKCLPVFDQSIFQNETIDFRSLPIEGFAWSHGGLVYNQDVEMLGFELIDR